MEAPPSTVGSAPPDERLNAVDQILETMKFGNIAFNVPERINGRDTAVIQLLLSLAKPSDELKLAIEAAGLKEGARIRVSDRMEARLTGPNFSITAVTPEVQAISHLAATEWKWDIKPTADGPQSLHLTLSALITIDGASTPRAIRTFDKTIDVEVTTYQRVNSFLQNNWQWLWATVLVPIVGWVWKRRRSAQPKNVQTGS